MKLRLILWNRKTRKKLDMADAKASAAHKQLINTIKEGRKPAADLKETIQGNHFTITIAKAMTGNHK